MVLSQIIPHEKLISWLKFVDIEYLSHAEAELLSAFDINDKEQRQEVFRLAVFPEFEALNEVSKASLVEILESALSASEQDLQAVFNLVAMPFTDEISSKKAFLQSLNELVNA